MLSILILLLAPNTFAFTLNAPDEVHVTNEGQIRFDITNSSFETKTLSVEFFTPAEYSISTPNRITPDSTETIIITIKNYSQILNTINSKLIVRMGEEVQEKNIKVIFEPTSQGNDLTAMFSFSSILLTTSTFTFIDWIIFIILVIIAAFLVVMLAAKIFRRS